LKRAAILSHLASERGGGPHVYEKFTKDGCSNIVSEKWSYKYAEVINIEGAYFIILHLFMCKEISLKLCLQINESNFRVRVTPMISYILPNCSLV
jgi:hypothetical protein